MAQRGPGADTQCLSQRGAGPSIFLLLWEMAGDIPELLGPGAHGNFTSTHIRESRAVPPWWVTPQPWDLAWGGCVHWGQEKYCGSLGRAGDNGQMRQRGCREDRGCLVARQAARGSPELPTPPGN